MRVGWVSVLAGTFAQRAQLEGAACTWQKAAARIHQQPTKRAAMLSPRLAVPPQRHLQHVDIIVAPQQRPMRVQKGQRRAPRRQRVGYGIQLAAAELAALKHVVEAVPQALVQPLTLLHTRVAGEQAVNKGWRRRWPAGFAVRAVQAAVRPSTPEAACQADWYAIAPKRHPRAPLQSRPAHMVDGALRRLHFSGAGQL